MSEVTYIKGKDACLEESISKLQNSLKEQGFQIQEKSWLNPVKNVFSLHIGEATCPGVFTNGKGVSRKSTLASALGEFTERLSTNYFFSDYWLEPAVSKSSWLYFPDEKQFSETDYKDCLTPELWSLYDPDSEIGFNELLSFNDQKEKVTAIPLIEEPITANPSSNKATADKKVVYFPMNLLSNYYASNGLSAGNTPLESQVQAMSEIFERWVKNKILRENLCLPEVPNKILEQFDAVTEAMNALRDEGIELSVRDASLGGKYPVISVVLFEQASGRCFASFGAHPIFEVALERTLTESLQGRQLSQLDGFQVPIFDEFAVAEDENIENHFIDSSGLLHARFISNDADYIFHHWNFNGSTEQQWQFLVKTVHDLGAKVYVANYEHCGFPACRVIVPGMSEIYPFDELFNSNQNEGRLLREHLLMLNKSKDYAGLVDLIDALGFSDHQGVASLIGLMPDKGSFWANLKICDLRFWSLLAEGSKDEALDALHTVQYFFDPNNPMKLTYDAIDFALKQQKYCEEAEKPFEMDMINKLFGAVVANQVKEILSGELVFAGEDLGMDIFNNSKQHQALWIIYQKLHKTKEAGF